MGSTQTKGTSYGEICGWASDIEAAPWSLEDTQDVNTTLRNAYDTLVQKCGEVVNRCKVSKLEVRIAMMLKKQYPSEEAKASEMKRKECEKIQTWMMQRETRPGGVIHDALWRAFQEGLGTS